MKSRTILATSAALLLAVPTILTAAEKAKPAAAPKVASPKVAPPKADVTKVLPEGAEVVKIVKIPAFQDPVAVVEGMEIKQADLDQALTGLLAQQGKSLAEIPPEQKPQLYQMILDDMIVEKIVTKRASETKVTDEEIATVFEKFKANFGSEEELTKQIEKNGETVDGVRKNIRSRLQTQHWVDEQLAGRIEVADADADDFYKKNPEQFKMPEQVRASHILIKVEPEAKPDDVVAKEKAASAVLARVKKGEDFAKLADELSEDPSAKQNHGDLNFFPKDQMVPEFAEAAFKLKKGELSPEPVRSQFGYHVILVTDRKDPETMTLESVKPKLVAFLKNQKRESELMKLAKDLRAKADVKINLPKLPEAPAVEATTPPVSAPVK